MLRIIYKSVFILFMILISSYGAIGQNDSSVFIIDSGVVKGDLVGDPFYPNVGHTLPTIDHQNYLPDNRFNEYNLDAFIDNFNENTHHHLETTGDFAQINPVNVGFNGSSYKWTRHYLNGHRMDGCLSPGDELHKPFLEDTRLDIDDLGFSLALSTQFRNQMKLEQNIGGVGGRVPWTNWFINNISGHPSSVQREALPINDRKQIPSAQRLLWNYSYALGKYNAGTSIQYYRGSRMHTGFNYDGISEFFEEDFNQLFLHQRIGRWHAYFTHLDRDHLNAEYFYNQRETASYRKNAVSIHNSLHNDYSFGINYASERIEKVEESFARNIIDQDAEGMEPWYPSADVRTLSLHAAKTIRLDQNFSVQGDIFNAFIHHTPINESPFTHQIFYQPDENTRQLLHEWEFESDAFGAGILENKVGLAYDNNGNKTRIKAIADLTYDGMLFADNNYTFLNWQFDASITQLLGKWELGLRVARLRTPFDYDQVRFISNDYLNGRSFFLNDNGDRGDLFQTQGGSFTRVEEDLQAPHVVLLDLPIRLHTGRWKWTLTPQYRQYRNLWTVDFDGTPEDYGFFAQSTSGREKFYFNANQETNYLVRNWNTSLTERELDGVRYRWFNQPFYAGAHFRIDYDGP